MTRIVVKPEMANGAILLKRVLFMIVVVVLKKVEYGAQPRHAV